MKSPERCPALSDIKVVELGNFVSVPYCGKLLADCGAEVIKIEEPGKGDEARAYGPFPGDKPHPEKSGLFLYLNTNKLSVTANINTPTGREIVRKLLEQADVFIVDLPARQLKRSGFTFQKLAKTNSRLIVTSITPFGLTGPYKDYKGFHNESAALGGAFAIGHPDREPLTYPLLQGHYQAGIHTAMAIMMALMARRRTGEGQQIDISEADIWASYFGAIGIQAYIFANRLRRRSGHRMKGVFYPLCILPCKDGYISEVAVLGSQWRRFLELMGDGKVPEWYENDPRFADRLEMGNNYADELDAFQLPWLKARTKEEIFALCREKRIPFAPVYDVSEIVNHPHLAARNYFVGIDHPVAGRFTYPGAQVEFSQTPMKINRGPLLGEHNEEVLHNRLGFSKQQLISMTQAGVI